MFLNYEPINEVDDDKVQELVDNILSDGWIGAPILYHEELGLITGSHRAAALDVIAQKMNDFELTDDQDAKMDELYNSGIYKYDVTDIVDEWLSADEHRDVPYDNLGQVFKGTKIEKWKGEIKEW